MANQTTQVLNIDHTNGAVLGPYDTELLPAGVKPKDVVSADYWSSTWMLAVSYSKPDAFGNDAPVIAVSGGGGRTRAEFGWPWSAPFQIGWEGTMM